MLIIGLEPVMEIIESGVGLEAAQEAERRWIAFHKDNGARLVNITAGGDGFLGLSREQLAARAAKSRAGWNARTAEQRAITTQRHRESTRKWQAAKTIEERRISAMKREAVIGRERKRAAGIKGKAQFTAEELSAIARKRQQSLTPEQRSAATKKGCARLTPEQRSAKSRKAALAYNASLTPEQIAASTRRAREARWGKRPPV